MGCTYREEPPGLEAKDESEGSPIFGRNRRNWRNRLFLRDGLSRHK